MADTMIDLALVLAVLVVVPLALRLDERRPLDRGSGTLVLGAAAVAAVSMVPDEGLVAAGLAVPWLVAVGVLALRHVFPLAVRGLLRDALAVLPFAYLVTGAGWLVVSRYGGRPLDFGDTIVELTAVHFHYAGFVAPVFVLRLAGWLHAHGHDDRLARLALVAVVAATPLTAAGITFEPALGALGAVLFTLGLAVASVLTLRRVVPRAGRAAIPLAISSCSVLASMALAVAYAFGQWQGTPAPSLPAMVQTHGVLNALGFALCGTVGWLWERERGAPEGTPLQNH